MEVVRAALGPVATVHVLRFRHRPLPVVQRLLRARHHLTEHGSEGTDPLHGRVREKGHGFGQAAGIHAGHQIVQSFGQEDHGGAIQVPCPGAAVAPGGGLERRTRARGCGFRNTFVFFGRGFVLLGALRTGESAGDCREKNIMA